MTEKQKTDLLFAMHKRIADIVWEKKIDNTEETIDALNKVWEIVKEEVLKLK